MAFVAEPPVLPPGHFSWHWRPLGEERVELTVELETEEPTSVFGKTIEKALVPSIYHKDLVRSLSNLEEIVAVGFPK